MKTICKYIALMLILTLTVTMLAACGDKSGAIQSAFEKEGYTVAVVNYEELGGAAKTIVETVLGKDVASKIAQFDILVCTKAVPLAIVVKCPSAGDIKNLLTVEKEDGSKDTALFDELTQKGFLNGNCLLLTILPGPAEIFQNA